MGHSWVGGRAAFSRSAAGLLSLFLGANYLWAGSPVTEVTPDEQCKALERTDFTQLQDAPTQIGMSRMITRQGATPGYCRVQGYVMPQVGFDLRLPAETWNGKFAEVGCGGPCGVAYADAYSDPLRKGYACIATDMGHTGTGTLWASDNLQAKIDFGFRATHVVALAGKAIA